MYLRGLGNVDPASCPEGTYPSSYQMAVPMSGPPGMPRQQQYQTFYECKPIQGYTKAAQAPQITITVPTQVQTDISPQISPQFIQQDEPRDSPIVASTSQSTEASAFQEYLAQQEELDAARDAQLIELIRAGNSIPPPAPQYIPAGESAPSEQAVSVVADEAPNYGPFIILGIVGAAGAIFWSMKKRKQSKAKRN